MRSGLVVQPVVKPRFQLEVGLAVKVGPERIRLLEAVAAEGSITAAAKAVGLSYRAAWDAVQALNALFDAPLVRSQPGGREGGAAVVTPAGLALIQAFGKIETELVHVVGQLQMHLNEHEPLERLAWRLGMKTSARNTLDGVVTRVTDGAVNAEVTLAVGEGVEVTAVVTRASVAELGLVEGRPATALIKSSFVILAPGHEPLKISARNRLLGVVVEHVTGAVNDEVVLEIAGGVRIAAVVTRESGESLDLKVGDPAQALIKAGHVILAVD